jgi:hypothetical protein
MAILAEGPLAQTFGFVRKLKVRMRLDLGAAPAAGHDLHPEPVHHRPFAAVATGGPVVARELGADTLAQPSECGTEVRHFRRSQLESRDRACHGIHVDAHDVCPQPLCLDHAGPAAHERVAHGSASQVRALVIGRPEARRVVEHRRRQQRSERRAEPPREPLVRLVDLPRALRLAQRDERQVLDRQVARVQQCHAGRHCHRSSLRGAESAGAAPV